MTRNLAVHVLTLALAASGCRCVAEAATIRVDGAGSGDYLTIQEGVDAASYGDTVLVLPGVYSEHVSMDLDDDGISLVSRDGCEATIIRGDPYPAASILTIEDLGPDALLLGFTLESNGAEDEGGGVYCLRSSLTIEDCIIQDCTARYNGGGLALEEPLGVTIRDCTISRNRAIDGGGFWIWDGEATLDGNAVSDNWIAGFNAVGGGGGVLGGGSYNLLGNTFTGNQSPGPGGGLFVQYGAVVTAQDNWFTHNEGSGAAIYVLGAALDASGGVLLANGYADGSGSCIRLVSSQTPPMDTNVSLTGAMAFGNLSPLLVVGSGALPTLTGNSIDSNGHLVIDVRAGAHAGTLNATGNWWGTTNPSEIGNLIWDCTDDPGVDSCVDFSDWCTDPSCVGQVTSVEEPDGTTPATWGHIKSLYR